MAPMPHAPNQIPLGENLYFFTSPKTDTNECLIFCHGSQLHDNGKYRLLEGITVRYYTEEGQSNKTNPLNAIEGNFTPVGPPVTGLINNLTVWKGVGSGWTSKVHVDTSYINLYNKMKSVHGMGGFPVPHFVSIRRRRSRKILLKLGDIVNAVLLHNNDLRVVGRKPIDTFHFAGCRDNYEGRPIPSKAIGSWLRTHH